MNCLYLFLSPPTHSANYPEIAFLKVIKNLQDKFFPHLTQRIRSIQHRYSPFETPSLFGFQDAKHTWFHSDPTRFRSQLPHPLLSHYHVGVLQRLP